MRILGLLVALFVLGLPGLVEPVKLKPVPMPDKVEPGVMTAPKDRAKGVRIDKQDQPEDPDQDEAIFFTGNKRFMREASGETHRPAAHL